MEVVLISENEKKRWASFLEDNRFAIAWQSYEWREVLKRHYRFEFFPLAACDSGRIVGVLPLYRIRTAFGKDSLVSVPYAVAGGVVSCNEEAQSLLIGKAIEISKKYDSCKIILKQYKMRMSGDLLTDEDFYNRELDLTQGPEKLERGFADRNREMIGSTKDNRLVLEYPSDDVNVFHGLLLRHLHARGIPCVSKGWIEDLLRFKMYSIAILKSNGRPVAGTLVKEFKKTVSFPFTCLRRSRTEDNRLAYRLYWDLIQCYCCKGFEIFHSGRIPGNDVTDDFRLGWGGTKHAYYYQRYPNLRGTTNTAVQRGSKREGLERCWKLLPRSVAGAIGPLVVRMFP